jgi:O-succinylbenzoate synthase
MLTASWEKYILNFKIPAGTSRGFLAEKTSWFIRLWDNQFPDKVGIGECSIIDGLSPDSLNDIEPLLNKICINPNEYLSHPERLSSFPAVRFGFEMACLDLENGGKQILFNNSFSAGRTGIPINGLIWMGDPDFMRKQVDSQVERGYRCLKMKIGAIGFEEELMILKEIRSRYSSREIELRVDANGAFTPDEALQKLNRLCDYDLHSIEQPIAPGNPEIMADLCHESPLPIALDEELFYGNAGVRKQELLEQIRPAYIVLKPTLTGGYAESQEWIDIAENLGIKWWITSALESNIGLNAIAQWAANQNYYGFQGLGTGSLYLNNIPSKLEVLNGNLFYSI